MNKNLFVPAILAAAMLSLPAAALAQSQSDEQNHQGQWQQCQQGQQCRQGRDRDDRNRDDRNRNQDNRDRDQRDRDHRNHNGQSNNGRYGNGGNGNGGGYYGRGGGYGNGNYGGQLQGVVSSFGGFSLQLSNGPHIDLHQGTVINPTGTTLQPGMQVQVYGHNEGNGSFAADTINVVGNNGYGNNGNYGNYGGLGSGILQSILGNIPH